MKISVRSASMEDMTVKIASISPLEGGLFRRFNPTMTTTQQSPSNQRAEMAERDSVNDGDKNAFLMERSLGYMTVTKTHVS
jgi:hypothetical protein